VSINISDYLPAPAEEPKVEAVWVSPFLRLDQLERHRPGDPRELLKHWFLCRGGTLQVCVATGIGKSSFIVQCAIEWGLGRPAFGIEPTRPMQILIIQAENDDGDMGEIVDGVFSGLNLSEEDQLRASTGILTHHCNNLSGFEFIEKELRPALKHHKPDLVFIDPTLAYLGGDANSQKDVGGFLRNGLHPLLTEFNCGLVYVHHPNKPPSNKEKSGWQGGDFAYSGTGSAEFANFARATLVIQRTEVDGVFKLFVPKRGSRLGWKDADGNKVSEKLIGHSLTPGEICWREADESELPPEETQKGKTDPTDEDFLAHVPTNRHVKKGDLMTNARKSMSRRAAEAKLDEMLANNKLFTWEIPRSTGKPEIVISRCPRPEGQLVS